MKKSSAVFIGFAMLCVVGCAAPEVKLFSDATDPLKEFTLEGTDADKVLLISIRGLISTQPEEKLLRSMPSMVQEVVSQLNLAAADAAVKSIVLVVDSPGGGTTASDILYHEIKTFRERTGKKIVAAMMGVAASGAYYLSLPADLIYAHPTTLTGSVGVILVQPDVSRLMDKVGVGVNISKSGSHKDMGTPYRPPTPVEKKILQDITDGLASRFLELVAIHRQMDAPALADIATARVYLAAEARTLKLIDEIGYLKDAIDAAKAIADLPSSARVVAYRRNAYPDDNPYNPSTAGNITGNPQLVDLGLFKPLSAIDAGFYYLWAPALGTAGF